MEHEHVRDGKGEGSAARAASWLETREYLVSRLGISRPWLLRGDAGFTWWPGFLPQRVLIEQDPDGNRAQPYDLLSVTITTDVAYIDDRDRGLDLAASGNDVYPYGAFVYHEDGLLQATSSLVMTRRHRHLLPFGRESALAQATVAHALASDLLDEQGQALIVPEGVRVCYEPHPESGMRFDLDPLLATYAGATGYPPAAAEVDGFDAALSAARQYARAMMSDLGWEVDPVDESVDYFAVDGLDVMVADARNLEVGQRYGRGLLLLTRTSDPGVSDLPVDLANDLNRSLARATPGSHVSNFRAGRVQRDYGLHTQTYLNYAFLTAAAAGGSPSRAGSAVCAAILDAVAGIRSLRLAEDDRRAG